MALKLGIDFDLKIMNPVVNNINAKPFSTRGNEDGYEPPGEYYYHYYYHNYNYYYQYLYSPLPPLPPLPLQLLQTLLNSYYAGTL